MPKFILPLIFLIVSYFILTYLPWYFIGILAVLAAAIQSGSLLKTFAIYFVLGFSLWYGMAMMNDVKSGAILSSKIAILFGNVPKQAILLVTGLIGGITSGLGGLLGNSIHGVLTKVMSPKQTLVK